MTFSDKVCIITGASSGIGLATKDLLRSKDCKVYNLDKQIPAEPDPYFFPCDVSKKEDVRRAVAAVVEREGTIDYLFSNAGVHLFATLEETSFEELEAIVGINVLGTFYMLKEVIPVMKKAGKGSIVLMGSDQSFVGKASSSVYGMTKGAIGQLTKSTAIDYAPFNIRVNCICPGTIDTPLLHKAVAHFSDISGQSPDQINKSLNAIQPWGRIGKPEEIARSVVFLLSDESSFTTGTLFAVDGGYVCQ